MSIKFGDMRQIAFVVHDIDQAMEYWTQVLGIGPFFIKRNIEFADYCFRGTSAESPTVSIALANSGFMQIELVQQHDNTPSIYREFLDANKEGLQHVSAWMTHEAMQNRKRDLLVQGVSVAQECVIPSSGVHLVYFETTHNGAGIIYEISDLLEPRHQVRIQNIANAAQVWDGQDPVREVSA